MGVNVAVGSGVGVNVTVAVAVAVGVGLAAAIRMKFANPFEADSVHPAVLQTLTLHLPVGATRSEGSLKDRWN